MQKMLYFTLSVSMAFSDGTGLNENLAQSVVIPPHKIKDPKMQKECKNLKKENTILKNQLRESRVKESGNNLSLSARTSEEKNDTSSETQNQIDALKFKFSKMCVNNIKNIVSNIGAKTARSDLESLLIELCELYPCVKPADTIPHDHKNGIENCTRCLESYKEIISNLNKNCETKIQEFKEKNKDYEKNWSELKTKIETLCAKKIQNEHAQIAAYFQFPEDSDTSDSHQSNQSNSQTKETNESVATPQSGNDHLNNTPNTGAVEVPEPKNESDDFQSELHLESNLDLSEISYITEECKEVEKTLEENCEQFETEELLQQINGIKQVAQEIAKKKQEIAKKKQEIDARKQKISYLRAILNDDNPIKVLTNGLDKFKEIDFKDLSQAQKILTSEQFKISVILEVCQDLVTELKQQNHNEGQTTVRLRPKVRFSMRYLSECKMLLRQCEKEIESLVTKIATALHHQNSTQNKDQETKFFNIQKWLNKKENEIKNEKKNKQLEKKQKQTSEIETPTNTQDS